MFFFWSRRNVSEDGLLSTVNTAKSVRQNSEYELRYEGPVYVTYR